MERLDKAIVSRGLVVSREKAQTLIKNGLVDVNGKKITKSSLNICESDKITIKENQTFKYVSRGGFKLEKAIQVFGLNFKNKIIMDIGSSTGGFTDCSIKNGAKKVIAVDVGENLLDASLRNLPQVVLMENTNVKNLDNIFFAELDFVVTDVSFISLIHIIKKLNDANTKLDAVLLIKPQFECGKEVARKYKGVVKNKTLHKNIINNLIKTFNEFGFYIKGLDYSPICGGDGNIEYISYVSNKIAENSYNLNINNVVDKAFLELSKK